MASNQVSSFTREVLDRKSVEEKASVAVYWGAVNLIVFVIIVTDLHIGGWSSHNLVIWWVGLAVSVVCFINTVVHLKEYVSPSFILSPLTVNIQQRKLMAILEKDNGFQTTSPNKKDSTPSSNKNLSFSDMFEFTMKNSDRRLVSVSGTPAAASTPANTSAGSWAPTPDSTSPYGSAQYPGWSNWAYTPVSQSGSSWGPSTPINQSAGSWGPSPNARANEGLDSPVSPLNFSMNSSYNSPTGRSDSLLNTSSIGSVNANSWSYHGNHGSIMDSSFGCILPRSPSGSAASPTIKLPFLNKVVEINNSEELDKYLSNYHDQQKKLLSLSDDEINNSMNSSLWVYGYGQSPNQNDLANLVKKNVYQKATKDVGEESSAANNKSENPEKFNSLSSSVNIVWTKRNVSQQQLFQYEENLRIWMTSNILLPLVKAIDKTNEALASIAPELQIGSVGVDKLKKAVQNISGVKNLANILPFLDLTLHQDYLVHRLRQLSKGGAISAFKWNGGSSFNGKKWWDEYPTDTFILLHLFAMYMDTQLPPDPLQPEGRVFSSFHVVKTPEKPPKPATHCILHLTQVNPPHIKVIVQDEECEVGSGHKNFMHSLLLFCHHVTHDQHSRIGGVNLDLSGINLSWVVGNL